MVCFSFLCWGETERETPADLAPLAFRLLALQPGPCPAQPDHEPSQDVRHRHPADAAALDQPPCAVRVTEDSIHVAVPPVPSVAALPL